MTVTPRPVQIPHRISGEGAENHISPACREGWSMKDQKKRYVHTILCIWFIMYYLYMYIYIYTHTHVCEVFLLYVWVCAFVYIHACMSYTLYVCIYIYIYIHIHLLCMYGMYTLCVYRTDIYICIPLYRYIIYIYIHYRYEELYKFIYSVYI